MIYQDSRPIKGRYTLLARNQVGFRIDRYDRTRALVIDPILLYCTYMGSSGADRVTAMKMGPNGLLYITGSTTTGEMPYIDGAYNNLSSGLTDIFLAIVDTTATATSSSSTSLTSAAATSISPLALEVRFRRAWPSSAGSTTSTNFPMAGNSVQTTGAGSAVAGFVAVIDPTLYGGDSLVYSTYLGGTDGNTAVNGIGCDSAAIHLRDRHHQGHRLPAHHQRLRADDVRSAGRLPGQDRSQQLLAVYSTYLGGELTDEGRAIAVGTNGRVYFAAITTSTQFPMEGPSYRQNLQGRSRHDRRHDGHDQVRHSLAGLLHLSWRIGYRRSP